MKLCIGGGLDKLIFILIILPFLFGCASQQSSIHVIQKVTPYQYGLSVARTDIDRYWAIYKAHTAALESGAQVDYSGIDSLDIEIPKDAKPIPLTKTNNFGNVIFNVTNKAKDFFLFELVNTGVNIKVDKESITLGLYREYPQLTKEKHIICISDNSPWVEVRDGYNYGHTRKDIILIEKGRATNKPIMPYNNDYSDPLCIYYPRYIGGVIVEDVIFNRTKESTYKSFFCQIKGVDELLFSNVCINTPANSMDSDQAICFYDCTNVTLKDVIINGTYSRRDYSGYGVSMNNIWNFKAINMYGHGNWGVFGTNNINTAFFENCDINRFDIHCYGRNVRFKNVTFRNRYNSFSSVFGTIMFEGCIFINFVPIVGDASYNAHVGYDVVFKNCEFSTNHDTPQLIYDYFIDKVNSRPELSQRCLPNVSITNLVMHINDYTPNAYLFILEGEGSQNVKLDYISQIDLDGIHLEYDGSGKRAPVDFMLFNTPIEVNNSVRVDLEDIDVIGNALIKDKNRGRLLKNLNNDNRTYKEKRLRVTSIK